MADTITEDGEIVEHDTGIATIDTAALATIVRTEIDIQIATARAYPRSIDRAIKNIIQLASLDEETAAECCYALVRQKKRQNRSGNSDDKENKPIEGPSIRLAEIAAQSWGNCRTDARVVAVNKVEMYVEAEGTFLDLETNTGSRSTVRRRISTRDGRLFSADMIVVTGNAACAIAKRNAILAGIPRGVSRPGYLAARKIIAGTQMTLVANRDKSYAAFAAYGVKPQQLFVALDVEGDGDITPDHIAILRAMFASLKNGESTVEEMFAPPRAEHEIVKNALSDTQDDSKPETQAKAEIKDSTAPISSDVAALDATDDGNEAANEMPDDLPLSLLDAARGMATHGRREFDQWYNTLTAEQVEELKPDMPGLMKVANKAMALSREGGVSPTLLDEAQLHATEGREAFDQFFNKLKPAQLDELKPHMKDLAKMAKAADAKTSDSGRA